MLVQEKSVVRWTDRLNMTIAVDKTSTKQTKQEHVSRDITLKDCWPLNANEFDCQSTCMRLQIHYRK